MNIPDKLRSLDCFCEKHITEKIRTNKEIVSFIKHAIYLKNKPDDNNFIQFEKIKKLGELRDSGLISNDEFENKKKEILIFLFLSNALKIKAFRWGGRRDSNPRHSEPQSDALTN